MMCYSTSSSQCTHTGVHHNMDAVKKKVMLIFVRMKVRC